MEGDLTTTLGFVESRRVEGMGTRVRNLKAGHLLGKGSDLGGTVGPCLSPPCRVDRPWGEGEERWRRRGVGGWISLVL